jgi:hypothetical protein
MAHVCFVLKIQPGQEAEYERRHAERREQRVALRTGDLDPYTRPSPGRYRWQWYWDSCFAAIAWRHFDQARPRAELETLLAQGLPGLVELVKRNREREFRIDAVRADGDPVVCEVLTNVIHGLSRLALELPSITPALIARCYDEPSGLFLPAVQPAIKERIPLTWTALAPLALPDLPDEIGHRLVGYLLDERRFWTAVAPPSVSLDEPSFSLRDMGAQDFAWSAQALELLDPSNANAGLPIHRA